MGLKRGTKQGKMVRFKLLFSSRKIQLVWRRIQLYHKIRIQVFAFAAIVLAVKKNNFLPFFPLRERRF